MRKPLPLLLVLFWLFDNSVLAQTQSEPDNSPTALELRRDFTRLFIDEAVDEFYPRPYFELFTAQDRRRLFGDNYLAAAEWEELEDRTFREIWSSFRHAAGMGVAESAWFKEQTGRLTRGRQLDVKPELQRREGMHQDPRLVVDTEVAVIDDNRSRKLPPLKVGIRFDKLDNPGFYLQCRRLVVENELLWRPVREELEWAVTDLPRDADFAITWEYGDEEVKFRFLKNPLARWFDFDDDTGAYFSINYDYSRDNGRNEEWKIFFGYYTRF